MGYYQFKNFLNYEKLTHFITTRTGGTSSRPYDSLNLAFHTGDDPQNVLKNRKSILSIMGINLGSLTLSKQPHGGNIKIITEEHKGRGSIIYEDGIDGVDALITNFRNICLVVLSADCVPVVLYDFSKNIIGIVHAGWRGPRRRRSPW